MFNNGNGLGSGGDPGSSAGIWIYAGMGVAVIIAGVTIFHFATPKKESPQAAVSAAPAAPSRPAAPAQFTGFPAFGSPAVSVGVQTGNNSNSGKQVVLEWSNLPPGTQEINVFEATDQGTSTLVATIKIPTPKLRNGSSTLNIPNLPQDANFFGTPSGGTPPSNGTQNSSTTTNQSSTNSTNSTNSTTSTTSTSGTSSSTNSTTTSSTSTNTNNTNNTNNVVTAVCSPSSILLTETSQCVLSVNSVAQNNVAWTMAFGSAGSVSASGLYTPSVTGTEAITGTLPDGTWADGVVTVSSAGSSGTSSSSASSSTTSSPSQGASCPPGYVLNGNTCIKNGNMPIQSTLNWNGGNYNVENGLSTSQDMVYISGVTNDILSSATLYCSYSQYAATPQYLGNGNYEITGLSLHGCSAPNSINYVDFGGFEGNGLDISITAP